MPLLAEEKSLYVVNPPDDDTEIAFKNPVRELGFAQIEHIVGLDTSLSDGAYRTFAILYYFWQDKRRSFPSLTLLATLRGKDEKTIRRHLEELTDKGIISRQSRAGTSSITWLEDLPKEYQEAAKEILIARKVKKDKNTYPSQKCPGGWAKMSMGVGKNVHLRITNKNNNEGELSDAPRASDPPSQNKTPPAMQAIDEFNALPSASNNAVVTPWAHFQEEWRAMVDNPYAGIAKNLRKRVESCWALDTDWQYFDKAKETFRLAVLSGRIPSVPTLFVGEWEKTLATQKIRGRAADSPTGMGHLPLHEATR